MAGKANPCGKMRPVEKPYEIWTSRDGSWEHRVLKKYQLDDNNPFARWFVAVKSPFTYGEWEYGDSYAKAVKYGNTRTYIDPRAIRRPPTRKKLCAEFAVAGMPIMLHQEAKNRFTVTYWKQVTDGLTYSQAATELGSCIMHALACDGQLDNRARGEA